MKTEILNHAFQVAVNAKTHCHALTHSFNYQTENLRMAIRPVVTRTRAYFNMTVRF